MSSERDYYRYWGKALFAQNPVLHSQLANLTGLDKTSFSQWALLFLALLRLLNDRLRIYTLATLIWRM